MRPSLAAPACAVLTLCCLFSLGCNGKSSFSSTGGSTGGPPVTNDGTSVSVMVSDPAACKAPGGLLSHVYITITDVKASTNPEAPANDPSFVDLTPGLSAAPQQVDLLGKANSHCFLASLSVDQQIAAGNYQQLRVFLAPDSEASKVSNNACGASYSNCVVKSDNSLHDLQLTAAVAKGIEIPTTEIANAGIAIDGGTHPSLDVDFDTCSSILLTPEGGYEFNPAIHVGVIPASGGSISGTVVSSATGRALQGGDVVVALEQKDAKSGIDRVLMRTTASATGAFTLCPVPEGTYDLVAVGVDGAHVSYSPGVELGIRSGQLAGQIPLLPGTGQGTLQGAITTQNMGRPIGGVSVAMRADAFVQLTNNGPKLTIPLLPSDDPYNGAMLTTNASFCPEGVDCAAYSLQLPAMAPNVAACSEQTAPFSQQGSLHPNYTAESFAQIAGSGVISDCMSNNLSVTATAEGRAIELNSNQSTTAAPLAFTQCE